MASKLKGVIKASSYSDGGTTSGMPPTYQDRVMRIKHTTESVKYNIQDHANDHLAEGVAQLGKLAGVDRGKASELAYDACRLLDKWYSELEQFKIGDDTKHDDYR